MTEFKVGDIVDCTCGCDLRNMIYHGEVLNQRAMVSHSSGGTKFSFELRLLKLSELSGPSKEQSAIACRQQATSMAAYYLAITERS